MRTPSLEKVVQLLQSMDPSAGLSIAQTLIIVARYHPQGVTQVEIGRILDKPRQSVTYWLDRLGNKPLQYVGRAVQNLNLTYRGTGPDGRTNLVYLTKHGEHTLNAL